VKEQDVQKKIINELEARGAWVIKTITTNKRGCPDILACLNGLFLAIEVKAKGRMTTVTPLQRYQIDQITEAGGLAFAADCVDTVKEILDGR